MKPGIYKIYGVFPDSSGERLFLYGRILITEDATYIVEDNRSFLERILPDGPIDQQKKRRWQQTLNSPYMRVERDEPNQQSEHLHEGQPKAEALFDLIDEVGNTHNVEVFPNDNFWFDGKHLNEDEVAFVMEQISSGRYKLLPR